MWRQARIALWAHSFGSWAAIGAVWIETLRQPNCPPIDGQFWLIFGFTFGLAPLWLPLSVVLYQPVVGANASLTIIAAVYVAVAAVTAVWRTRREGRRLRAHRRATGHCIRCGYDLRATQARCPECGKVNDAPPDPPTIAPALSRQ